MTSRDEFQYTPHFCVIFYFGTMTNLNFSIILFVISVFVRNGQTASRIDPLVETKVGLIRGLRSPDGQYSMFMGIPYATVDKVNPFGVSTEHPGFDEVFEAFDDSAICPQVEEFNNTIVGSLDCLHVNVYVPNSATSKNRLPVLVWIYGGGFSIGYSGRYLYGPSYLVRHDVILVTFNYRLGPYGFMCLDTPSIPGNQGLKDQELALKWIKNNIHAFGGDSNKITLFGESAGGASVDLHLINNKENLFNQVILQSGTSLSPWVIVESDSSKPLKLAEYLGFATEDVQEALAYLAKVDTKLVIAASHELNISFKPCVENRFDGVQNFMTEYPVNLEIPRVKNIPVLIGFNNDERVTDRLTWSQYTNEFYEYLRKSFGFEDETLDDMKNLITHFYIGDDSVNEETISKVADFESDINFVYPTERSIQKYIQKNAKAIYQYIFSYNGQRNFLKKKFNMTEGGAAHADEIGYLFDISYMINEPTPEDQLVIDQITTLWTNFVKYGNPTPETTYLLPVTWEPITEDTHYYLNIDSELKLERRPFHNRMAFWELFHKLNKKYENGYKDLN